jgi:hypothetical protein
MHGLALFTNLNAGGWRSVVPPDPAAWTKAEIRAFREFAVRTPIALAFASGYCSDATKRWPTNYVRQLQYGELDGGFVGAIPYNTPMTTARPGCAVGAD